jgi:spermidine/putrescine transport system substrate-binding protein
LILRPPYIDIEDVLFVERYRLSRAALIKRTAGVVLGASAAGAILAACGGGDEEKASGTVTALLWQGYDDPKAAAPLTDQGVKVSTQYVANNDEFITKLRGGGLGKFDIVTPYHGYIEALVTADLIQPLDYGRLPSTDTYLPQFAEATFNRFDGDVYSAPLVWGDTPMVYRTDLVKTLPESWLDLKNPEYKGKVVLWDDGFGHILLFSKVLFGPEEPNRITREQLDQVMAALGEIKKNAVTIAPSHGDAADIIARGDGAIQTEGWAYVAELIKSKGKPAKTYLPKEGAFAWADSYCLCKDAPNETAAYAFIDTMVSPEGDAQIAGATSSGVTNEGALDLLTPEQKALYPYDDLDGYFARLGFYSIPPLEPEGDIMTLKDWTDAWDEFKAS